MNLTISRAKVFAARAHGAQVRKYTGEPYINHPEAVVGILEDAMVDDPNMIAAAWLHDVLEDTATTREEIREHFGEAIFRLVVELTNASQPEDGNRAKRKEIDRQFLLGVSLKAKTIKLADLIDNTRSIMKHDPKFARVYVPEARALLQALRGGDIFLWLILKEQLDNFSDSATVRP